MQAAFKVMKFLCSVFKVQKSLVTPIANQRSVCDWKRRRSEMSELSPKAEARDMELVSTTCAFSSVGRATDS